MVSSQRKASEILKEIETQVANLEIGNYNNSIKLARLADERGEMSRQKREYESMFWNSQRHLKKIANCLNSFNASKATKEQLEEKIKTIRILLESHDQKVIKKDYEVLPD